MIDFVNQNKQVYNAIASFFSSTRAWIWDDMRMLEKHIGPGNAILDVGCGNGRLYQLCREKQAVYTGIDQSEELVHIAQDKFREAAFVVGSMTALPFADASFDRVFCVAAFHHLPDMATRVQALQEMKRVLRPGGVVAMLNWNLLGAWGRTKLEKGFIRHVPGSKDDFLVPWKDPTGQVIGDRFYHSFTFEELEQLYQTAGFSVQEQYYIKKGKPSDADQGENIWTLLTL